MEQHVNVAISSNASAVLLISIGIHVQVLSHGMEKNYVGPPIVAVGIGVNVCFSFNN